MATSVNYINESLRRGMKEKTQVKKNQLTCVIFEKSLYVLYLLYCTVKHLLPHAVQVSLKAVGGIYRIVS
jgi:hypothetical protein